MIGMFLFHFVALKFCNILGTRQTINTKLFHLDVKTRYKIGCTILQVVTALRFVKVQLQHKMTKLNFDIRVSKAKTFDFR